MPAAPEQTLALDELRPGDRARVLGFKTQSPYTAQLMRMGLIPGTEFAVVRRAPLGDPMEIRFRDFDLVLRPSEASELLLGPA